MYYDSLALLDHHRPAITTTAVATITTLLVTSSHVTTFTSTSAISSSSTTCILVTTLLRSPRIASRRQTSRTLPSPLSLMASQTYHCVVHRYFGPWAFFCVPFAVHQRLQLFTNPLRILLLFCISAYVCLCWVRLLAYFRYHALTCCTTVSTPSHNY